MNIISTPYNNIPVKTAGDLKWDVREFWPIATI